MRIREIRKYNLDFEKTFPYFINHIKCGKTLSQKIIEGMNFYQGSFFTLLPSNAELDKLYEFSYGGIIPSISYGNQIYYIESCPEGFHPQQVITMDHEFSEFIAHYIKANYNNCAIIENVMSEPDDVYANIENVKMVTYAKEVYYFLDEKNSVNQIYKTIRKASQVWHFLALLTVIKNIMPTVFKDENLDQVCFNSKFVVAGAYDGEGFIFWEKDFDKAAYEN